MAKKDDVILVLLFTLAKIRTLLDVTEEQLTSIEKREGGGIVPVKKQSKAAPKLPKGRIGKSVKKK